MAFNNFMNMERLTLEIINDHILNMTDDNYEIGTFLSIDELTNNMKNGFVIITQLSCFIESFFNTIINSCMNYNGESLLKCNIEEKIDLIFLYYEKDWSNIKGQNPWSVYKKTTKVRNEMIHFKRTYIGDGAGIPDFEIGGQKVSQFFTKSNMLLLMKEHIKLVKLIANTLELSIYEEGSIFECDGRDNLVNYVYDKKIIDIDESRFESNNQNKQ